MVIEEEERENQEELNEEQELEAIEELKQIPGIDLYESGGIYTITKQLQKGELQIEFEEGEDLMYLWINHILIYLQDRDVTIKIAQYGDTDHYVYFKVGNKKFEKDVEDEFSEPLYFLGFGDVIDVFSNSTEFINEKVEEFLNLYKEEIDSEIVKGIRNLLRQL
jgi:hypothetical protein|nr:hypothetical protein [Candidatus Aramenus sulfurataquae]